MHEGWNRLTTFWLVEALEHAEHDGFLEDDEILGCLAQGRTLQDTSDEELVVRRSIELSGRHPRVIRLKENIGRLTSAANHLLVTSVFLALLAGLSAASAIFSTSNSVNIVTAWFGLAGVSLIFLGLTVLLMLAGTRIKPSLPAAWLWLLGRVGRNYDGPLLLRALGTLIARTGKIGAFLTIVSHLLWIAISVGAMLGSLYFLFFRQYAFVWETTILPTNFFVGFTRLVGTLPCMVDLYGPCPSAADIANLADLDETRKAWTKWLLGSIVAYGLAPRLLALSYVFMSSRRAIDDLSIDFSTPYYLLLARRIRERISSYEEIIDPDPGKVTATGDSRSNSVLPEKPEIVRMIVPFEVRDLPEINLAIHNTKVIQAPNVRTHEDQKYAIRMLPTAKVFKLLFIVDAGVSADRGVFQFLRQVGEHAMHLRVVLLRQSDARKDKLDNWLDGLSEMGIATTDTFSQLEPALKWISEQEKDNT